jgi:hypothetical protein
VQKLATQIAADPSLFAAHLPHFVVAEGHRLYEFGVKLAEELCLQEIVEAVIAAQVAALPEIKTQFIGGYFSGLKGRFPHLWEASVSRLLHDDTSREIGVEVVLGSGVSENTIHTLLQLFRQGHVRAVAFSRLAWQAGANNIPQTLVEEVLAVLVDSADDEALKVAIQLAYHYFFNRKKPRACDENLLLSLLSANQFFRQYLETMTKFYWHSVAEGFRERFPERELELLSVILSHPEHLSSVRASRSPGSMADEIVRTHPEEAWSMVSRLLESDETHSLVAFWLGDEFGFGEQPQGGAIRHLDPDMLMEWMLQNPEIRVWKLLRCLPKTLDERDGGRITQLFLETFGDHEEVAKELIAYFLWSGGWMGPESAHRAAQRDKARQWVSDHKSGKVLAWLYRYIEYLTRLLHTSNAPGHRYLQTTSGSLLRPWNSVRS